MGERRVGVQKEDNEVTMYAEVIEDMQEESGDCVRRDMGR